tara:strand:+ start:1920 stop:2042 length:123 start_codon:yes stop_codon:yes gene_type:complete
MEHVKIQENVKNLDVDSIPTVLDLYFVAKENVQVIVGVVV